MRIDLKKDLRELYQPGPEGFADVVVPPRDYLAIDGHGDPNTTGAYLLAVQALYAGAYAVRAAFKTRTGDDFVVGPLEGLWSSRDPSAFSAGRKAEWDWTMLIPWPAAVSDQDIQRGLSAATTRKPDLPIPGLRTLALDEGRVLQILHIGPYDAEGPTLARLHHEVMPAAGLTWNGRHHEIYLGDPRRTAPEKLRTILRQPLRPGS